MSRRPSISSLFPYTTLFRSVRIDRLERHLHLHLPVVLDELPPDLGVALRNEVHPLEGDTEVRRQLDRKSTRLNSSHTVISYAVFCLKKKKKKNETTTNSDKQ